MKSLTATLAVAFVLSGAMAQADPATHPNVSCPKTFTSLMAARAIDATYSGTRRVSTHDTRMLHRILKCLRNPGPHKRNLYVRWRHAHAAWWTRLHPPMPHLNYGLASWYTDIGATASGYHATYGVAVCGSAGPCYPFGTKILFVYHGRSVVAEVDDHGPYCCGRNFDLNQGTAGALGFDGVGTVGYHVQ